MLKYTKDNTIDNATHSLFRRQAWVDITDSDYEAIALSLRLSSLLIREVSLLDAMYGTKTFNVAKLGHYLRGYVKERISQASEDHQHKVSLLLRHKNFRFANFPAERRANGASTVRSD